MARSLNLGAQNALLCDVTQAVGLVPTVRLNKIARICASQDLYLKLEACNPGGSIKEKNAVYLVNDAEKEGLLLPGGAIIESSSGNFGIGLAMVGAARGYRVLIVVDAKTPPPIRRMLAAYGAELIDVPLDQADANGSMQVARMRRAAALAEETPKAWYPCQHLNPKNPMAHEAYTAREIIADFGGEAPDAIVVGVSTAGQIGGISHYFRERHPKTKIIGVDIAGSVIFGTSPHPYKMTGLGLAFVPPNFKPKHLDFAYSVGDILAFSLCRALAREEGLLLGGSTGAIVAAGLAYASICPQRSRILLINPDRGDRYLETIYDDTWIEKQGMTLLSREAMQAGVASLEPLSPSLVGIGV